VFQAKLMKKVLDLNAQHTAKVHEATTWSFSMEGERYFEGTRSFVTAAGIEKPLMNAYRAFARLGHRRLAATSDQSAEISAIDALGNGLPEEVDVIAGTDDDAITILIWRHTDDQYAADTATARVGLEVTGLDSGLWTVQHFRIDHNHSNSHTIWQNLGAPQDPTPEQLAAISARQGLERFADDVAVEIEGGLTMPLDLPLPALSLVVLKKGAA